MRIGIDLGGTKIEIIALADRGETLARRRVATPAGDYTATLDAIRGLIDGVERETAERGSIGIAMPGALSPATGLIKNANSACLIGQPLDADLGVLLDRPVRLANDANCFGLSEAIDGAGAGAEVVFGVIVGTGTGGGIAIRGKVLGGVNAIAGEWGHNPLPWPDADEHPGPDCYCGKRGCVETFLSGPAIVHDHELHGGKAIASADLEEAANAGDGAAEATLARYERRMAKALASVVNLLDPDVIVLGGGLSNIGRLYANVPRLMAEWAFTNHLATRLRRSRHGDSSGVRGAAWLWPAGARVP